MQINSYNNPYLNYLSNSSAKNDDLYNLDFSVNTSVLAQNNGPLTDYCTDTLGDGCGATQGCSDSCTCQDSICC